MGHSQMGFVVHEFSKNLTRLSKQDLKYCTYLRGFATRNIYRGSEEVGALG